MPEYPALMARPSSRVRACTAWLNDNDKDGIPHSSSFLKWVGWRSTMGGDRFMDLSNMMLSLGWLGQRRHRTEPAQRPGISEPIHPFPEAMDIINASDGIEYGRGHVLSGEKGRCLGMKNNLRMQSCAFDVWKPDGLEMCACLPGALCYYRLPAFFFNGTIPDSSGFGSLFCPFGQTILWGRVWRKPFYQRFTFRILTPKKGLTKQTLQE